MRVRAEMGEDLTCPAVDGKGLRCERPAGHPMGEGSLHQRWAIPGETPYVEGPGNSIVSWPDGPPPVAKRRIL